MKIVHETVSFQSIIYCTDESQVTFSIYGQAWNKYNFRIKRNTFCSNIDDTVGFKIFFNFWIYDVICPHM